MWFNRESKPRKPARITATLEIACAAEGEMNDPQAAERRDLYERLAARLALMDAEEDADARWN